jgi:hypothetical protein
MGIKGKAGRWFGTGRPSVPSAEAAEVMAERAGGATLAEIGAKHGVTKERIRQVILRYKRVLEYLTHV